MFDRILKQLRRCSCALYHLQSKQICTFVICLGLINLYLFLNTKEPERTDSYFETTAEINNVKKQKVGILIACSYHEINDSESLIILKLSTLCLPSLFQTIETRYDYQLYIGIESEIGSEHIKQNDKNTLNVSFLHITKASYADTINMLAVHAFNKGLDYFVIIPFDAQIRWKYWTSRAIMSLMGHCPSDVGVVLKQCDEKNNLSIVSRSHIERFGYVFPPELTLNQLTKWITSIYLPNGVSSFNINQEHDCQVNKGNSSYAVSQQHSTSQEEGRGSACVVSYSLYGSDKRYSVGATENAKLMKTIYPGWTMWVYHDSSVPLTLLNMLCGQTHIKCIDMTGSRLRNKRVWRFQVINSNQVARYIVRDIDSRLSMREKMAVNEWIMSGKRFHVIRDHPSHNVVINSGMWGGTGRSLSDLYLMMFKENPTSDYISDNEFLGRVGWPIIKTSVIQHDSYYCEKYKSKPFPTSRIGWEHVGSVFIDNRIRDIDIKILKEHISPKACQSEIKLFDMIMY